MKSKPLKIRTDRGGYKAEVSSSWNTKLTKLRKGAKHRVQDVPAAVLYREIDAAYNAFWAKRDTRPASELH